MGAEKGRKKVVIIGGGISGLSAAFYTQKLCTENKIPLDLTVIEKEASFGGKINTLRRDGFVIERGPDSFLARKTPILDISKDLGLEQELVGTNPKAKKTYILHKGKLHRMPPGLIFGIPTEVLPFVQTGLISPLGKLRAGLDLILPRRKEQSDEALGQFLERRLGKEVVAHIAEPLLAGIYAGDSKTLSLQATFPQFHQIEKKYRSLILGMLAGKKHTPSVQNIPEIARKSMFLTYKNGLSTLTERLVETLQDAKLLHSTGVESITPSTMEDQTVQYELLLSTQEVVHADAIIMATPPSVSAQLLAPHVPSTEELNSVRYASVANIVMTFNQDQISFPLDGSGFVVPRKEGRSITACTWTSVKWLHTAPQGQILLRCYVGRAGEEEIVHLSDQEIMEKVAKDLRELMGITVPSKEVEVTRLFHSMPQYPLGHLERIKRIRQDVAQKLPGILLTGAGYGGIGIPDCVRQGKEAAQEITSYIG